MQVTERKTVMSTAWSELSKMSEKKDHMEI